MNNKLTAVQLSGAMEMAIINSGDMKVYAHPDCGGKPPEGKEYIAHDTNHVTIIVPVMAFDPACGPYPTSQRQTVTLQADDLRKIVAQIDALRSTRIEDARTEYDDLPF